MKNAKNKTSRRETWKRLLAYIRKSLPLLALTIVFAGATVGLSLYIPILCGRAIDCMTGTGTVDFDGIARCLVKIGICASLCGILQWVMNSLNNRVAYRVIRDVRRDAFDTLTHLPLSYIDSHPHGGTVSRVIADVDQFADGLLLARNALLLLKQRSRPLVFRGGHAQRGLHIPVKVLHPLIAVYHVHDLLIGGICLLANIRLWCLM